MSLRLTELRGSLAHEEWRAARASLKLARRRLEQALGRCEAAAEADAAFAHRSEAARQRLDAARAARDAAARRLEAARIQVERGEGLQRRFADRLRSAVAQRGVAVADLDAIVPEVDAAAAALASVEARRRAAHLGRARTRGRPAAPGRDRGRRRSRDRGGAVRRGCRSTRSCRRVSEPPQPRTFACGGGARRTGRFGCERPRRRIRDRRGPYRRSSERRSRFGSAEANEAAARARLAAAKVGEARSAVDAAWEAVNAADHAVADAAADARRALATLADGPRTAQRQHRRRWGRSRRRRRLPARLAAWSTVCRSPMTRSPARSRPRSRRTSAPGSSTTSPPLPLTSIEKARANDSSAPISTRSPKRPAPEPYRLLSDALEATPAARGAVSHLLRGVWVAPTSNPPQRAFTLGATVAVLRDGTVVTPTGLRGGRAVDTIELARAERAASAAAERAERAEAAAVAAAANARDRLNDLDQALSVAVDADRAARAAEASAAALAVGAEQALDAATDAGGACSSDARHPTSRGERGARRRRSMPSISWPRPASATPGSRRPPAPPRRTPARFAPQPRAARVAAEEAELVLSRAKAEGAHVEERREAARRALDAARSRLAAAETRRLVAEGEALAAIVHGLQGRARGAGAALELSTAQQDHDLVALPDRGARARACSRSRPSTPRSPWRSPAPPTSFRPPSRRSSPAKPRSPSTRDAVRDLSDDDSTELDPTAAERAEREIVRLERRIAALGAVNALAPEQHEALNARGAHDRRAARRPRPRRRRRCAPWLATSSARSSSDSTPCSARCRSTSRSSTRSCSRGAGRPSASRSPSP